MDQITVSDIPLPGEEFTFKTEDPPSNTDVKTEPEVKPAEVQVELQPTTTEEAENIEINNHDTVTETTTSEVSEIQVPELKEDETEIVADLLQDVTEPETVQVECETVEELQMEVEEDKLPEQTDQEQQVVEEVVSQPTEVEIVETVETVDATEVISSEDNKTEVVQEETVPIVVESEPIVEEPVPIVEEPPTPAIEQEIIEENNKKVENIVEKPAKKISRTNSTIEAIKNDWADSLTIEEINEEEAREMNEAIAKPESEPETIPIVTEPEKTELEIIDEETIEQKLETLETSTETVEPSTETLEPSTETLETNTETVETTTETVENTEKNDGVTETNTVYVLETVNEEIVASVAENVTIEIIDNTQQQPSLVMTPETKQQQQTDNNKTDDKVTDESIKPEKMKEEQEEEKRETVYIVEEIANNNTPEQTVEVQKPRKNPPGRPSRASQRLSATNKDDKLQIPCHVLGRNVDNPTEDLISNGRTPPKPRLGVKVPYRFLTSQIVSKEEIADELNELTSKRNPAPDPPAGGDIFFASKLTQRLASKIALNVNKKSKPETKTTTVEATSGIPTEALNTSAVPPAAASGSKPSKNTIGDNSDLLAILEGDVDVDWTKEVRSKTTEPEQEIVIETKVVNNKQETSISPADLGRVRKLDPETERQLALKQLREMPMKKEGRGRPRKNYYLYETRTQYVKTKETPPPKPADIKKEPETPPKLIKKEPLVQKKEPVVQTPVSSTETNENIKQAVTKLAKKIKENESVSVPEIENDLNVNPRRVTKTYSRKEAVLDVPAELEYIVNEPESQPSALDADQSEHDKKQATEQPSTTTTRQKKNTTTEQQAKQQKKTKRSVADINKPEVTLVSKRARIIKKKVIWDPAEVPKTKVLNAIRKAQILEMKARKKQMKSEEQEEEGDDEEEETSDEEEEEQKPTQHRQLRKNKMVSRQTLTKVQKKKIFMKRQLRSLKSKLRASNGEFKTTMSKKKQVIVNKPRKTTELDRLLGDEGAVNMLYSVRQIRGSKKASVTQKELQNRKKVIKDVITQTSTQHDTPKALRKKESPALPPIQIPPRKKSRDSVRSSLQSPPPSPSYFHAKGAEASRIIRRHSSSFSSECSSPRRLSIEQSQQTNKDPTEDTSDFQSPVRVLRRKNIQQDAKKDENKTEKVEREKLSVAEKRKLNVEMSKNFDKTPKKRTRSSKGEDDDVKEDSKPKTPKKLDKDEDERFINVQTEYKEILLKKSHNLYQIVMNSPANAKLKNVINLQMFNELGSVLTKLSKDDSCKVVVLTSTGKSFCRGLDFSNLIQTTADKRSTAAQDTSKSLKEFILTIAKFPKPLVASVHSSSSLLGCTMLPYFDVVLCAETATLSADYTRVGHSPEGAPGLGLCPRVGPALATDMLMLGKRLTAKEAMDSGLVTRVEKPDKLDEATLKIAREISDKSQQCLSATKLLLRQPLLEKLEQVLELEAKLLIEHWVSPECQQNFKKLLQEEELW